MIALGFFKKSIPFIDPVKHVQGVLSHITESDEDSEKHQLWYRSTGISGIKRYPVPIYPENYKIVTNPPGSASTQSICISMKKPQDWKIQESQTAHAWITGQSNITGELKSKNDELELLKLENHELKEKLEKTIMDQRKFTQINEEDLIECQNCYFKMTKEDLQSTKGFCLRCGKVPGNKGDN